MSSKQHTKSVCKIYVKGTCWYGDSGTSCRFAQPKSVMSSAPSTHLKNRKYSLVQRSIRSLDTLPPPCTCVDDTHTTRRGERTTNAHSGCSTTGFLRSHRLSGCWPGITSHIVWGTCINIHGHLKPQRIRSGHVCACQTRCHYRHPTCHTYSWLSSRSVKILIVR